MNVKELIKELQLIKDKSLPVNIETTVPIRTTINYYLYDIEVNNTGSSGYEVEGEVRLLGGE